MDVLAVLGIGALGIPVGAFLNVVVDRVPDRVSLRGARDGEARAPIEVLGLPLQPWILRGGGGSDRPLPRRWLWVEVLTVATFLAFASVYGDEAAVVPLLVLAASLVAVSVIDLQLLRIPDRVTFPTLAVALPLMLMVSVREDATDAIVGALVGSIAYFVALFVPHLVYPRGMGFGDVKLALLMGLFLGWLGWTPDYPVLGPIRLVLYALILGCALGVLFGGVSAVLARRRSEFPFGPALALGCVVVLLFARDLAI